jgi:hypothetical protein
MLLAAAGLGHLFLRNHQFDSFVERLVFTLALGLGLWALLIYALGILGLLYVPVIYSLTIAAGLGTVLYLLFRQRLYRAIRLPVWRKFTTLRGALGITLLGLATGYWLLLLATTFYPPVHWDAISHHLLLCREYLVAHRLFAVMGNPHPVLPALNHMLFTWGMALLDDNIAQMIEHSFLMLTALGLYSWGKRQHRPLFGLAVAAFWLGNPLVLWLGESAYVDICLVSFVFLGVYGLRVFWEQREVQWWYLAMALLGLGAGVKLPGLFFIIIGGCLGLWLTLKPRLNLPFLARKPLPEAIEEDEEHPSLVPQGESMPVNEPPLLPVNQEPQRLFSFPAFLRGCAIAILLLIPWYAYIFYYTGNPIWPTFPEFSRGDWGSPAVIENTNSWLKNAAEPRTLVNFFMLSVDWIRYPSRFYAEINLTLFPIIAIWPLAWVVAIWNRNVRWWALWAFGFTAYWFIFPHLLRYWLPALPLAGLALYESIRWLLEKLFKSAILQAAVWILLTLAAFLWAGRGIHGELKSKGLPPTNSKTREAFLSPMGGFSAVKYINKQASASETVCIINGSYLNYYLKPHTVDTFGLLQSGRLPSFLWPEDEKWLRWLDSQNVSWILLIHANAPPFLKIPKQNLVTNPIWPDYELVFADSQTWVFRRKPVPPERL